MSTKFQVKICGLTREEDVDLALHLGASFFGFILYPKSPRAVSVERAFALSRRVPSGRAVLVDVSPSIEKVEDYFNSGFEKVQIHSETSGFDDVLQIGEKFGQSSFWIAPHLAPDEQIPKIILHHFQTILIDSYSKNQVGGTGMTGDWGRFRDRLNRFPENEWILAGGLNPSNICEAIRSSGAFIVDVNSGVEKAPGVKDHDLLRALFEAVESIDV